jgi:hypothetical protein
MTSRVGRDVPSHTSIVAANNLSAWTDNLFDDKFMTGTRFAALQKSCRSAMFIVA